MFTGSTSKRNTLALYLRRLALIRFGADEVSSRKASTFAKILLPVAQAERRIQVRLSLQHWDMDFFF
jgi:hypothetical protein